MHYRNERNFTAMLSHPAYLFLQGLVALFSLPLKSLFRRHLLGFFSPGLENDKLELIMKCGNPKLKQAANILLTYRAGLKK